MPEQIANRANTQLGQARRPFTPDTPKGGDRLVDGMRWRLGHWHDSTGNTALGQAVPVYLLLGQAESYTALPMSRDLETKFDHLWKEYTGVFM
ncbi:MAG: hypothetical protein VYE14_00800, partial [Verrucomicrobiota bacterium]|nr:hypothetical protein [Verrucomicrobiota bacterium]